jgi:dinuclear metal center YbgI/SA1388 family protein
VADSAGIVALMALPLDELLSLLGRIAPLELAESWDNVGLLVDPGPEPSGCGKQPETRTERNVDRVLFTIDLVPRVLDEALEARADVIVAYHPPIFAPLKRLTSATPQGAVLTRAIGRGLCIYSPHTALDAAPGGVNDWLAGALGEGHIESVDPKDSEPGHGSAPARRVALTPPRSVDAVVKSVKQHLGLSTVRLADAVRHRRGEPIVTALVCAGAGGSALAPSSGFDLLLTGEMRHHDVLAQVEAGTSVILCDHTNTERGYLPRFAERVAELAAGRVEVIVSAVDREPLRPV